MATVRIYQPPKTAMQSGKGKTRNWLVEFESKDSLEIYPLMGWISSEDTRQQLRLFFPSLEEAIQFAKVKGLQYSVCTPPQHVMTPKSYGINFTCSRMRAM
jgi:hypothetical protein